MIQVKKSDCVLQHVKGIRTSSVFFQKYYMLKGSRNSLGFKKNKKGKIIMKCRSVVGSRLTYRTLTKIFGIIVLNKITKFLLLSKMGKQFINE